MTIHINMFDGKEEKPPTMHRIYMEFEGGYFVTSLDPQFNAHLQDMVADLGPPTRVEFRATDEGWYTGDDVQN